MEPLNMKRTAKIVLTVTLSPEKVPDTFLRSLCHLTYLCRGESGEPCGQHWRAYKKAMLRHDKATPRADRMASPLRRADLICMTPVAIRVTNQSLLGGRRRGFPV